MRSRQEILFRLKQEAMNLRLYLAGAGHTKPSPQPGRLAGLPDPAPVFERLRGSRFADTAVALASDVLKHRYRLLTLEVTISDPVDWQIDPTHPERNGLGWRRRAHYRLVPYMDAARFGDYKVIWELNRQQHLPLLAQAWRFTGRREYLDEIGKQIASWRAQNPLMAGINWASALEAAFRVFSWIWTWHFASADLAPETRRDLLWSIEEHALFLEYNLSFYHSPNTHLIGEALALEGVGTLFPWLKRASRWKKLGCETLDRELIAQVRPDGGHFERSTYYHVYTLDMFLFHAVLSGRRDSEFLERLRSMARYLDAVAGPSRCIPLIGDDDGGRLYHPYGDRDAFCRATLAACGVMLNEPAWLGSSEDAAEMAAWWFGVSALDGEAAVPRLTSELFRDTGIAVLIDGETHIVMDVGPFAEGTGGHSHADTLSLTVRRGGEEILIDPGTYTYVLDPLERERFRGTAGHNTVRIDERDQATPAGPFRWMDHPQVEIVDWQSSSVAAVCRYRGFSHARAVWFEKPDVLMICDRIDGPAGEHIVEQFWHTGGSVQLILPPGAVAETDEGGEYGWRSPGLGTKYPARCVRVVTRGSLPVVLWTVFDLAGRGALGVDAEGANYRRDGLALALRVAVEENGCIKIVK